MGFSRTITLQAVELFPLVARGGVSPDMALGRMPVRPALLIKLIDSDGCFGWGEIWANFPARANIHKAHLVEDVLAPTLVGATFTEPDDLTAKLRSAFCTYFLHIGQNRVFEHLLAGIDCAAWDLALRSAGKSFAQFLDISPFAQSYASSLNRDDLGRRFNDHAAAGQNDFKLKIGFDHSRDLDFVAAAHTTKPDRARLMVDSNQSWSAETAREALAALADYDLLFAEEPIRADADFKDWEALAASSSIALAGGENFYGLDQFIAFGNAGVKILQPDVAKWGGVSGALALAEALPAGCRLWPHFMGSALGQEAALSVSAAIGVSSKCEMDVNENPLRTGLTAEPLTIDQGRVALTTDPGLCRPPTESALKRFGINNHAS